MFELNQPLDFLKNMEQLSFVEVNILNSNIGISKVWASAVNGNDVVQYLIPDSKVHGAIMGPTWVLSAPDEPHVGPMNLAIREMFWAGKMHWIKLIPQH